jgi:hypothetical protein
MESKIKVGAFVLLRTFSSGVHYGFMEEKNLTSGGFYEVRLSNAKRLWSWNGALSLSEVAMSGIKIDGSKIATTVDEIELPNVIEIIPISKKSNLINTYEKSTRNLFVEL